jgi:1-acyl-sn-glycerol-3-phosphate acyltransferase
MNLLIMPSSNKLPWYYWLYQPYKWLVFVPLMLINSISFALLAILFAFIISPRAGSFMGSCC